jgi:hypothetical protein
MGTCDLKQLRPLLRCRGGPLTSLMTSSMMTAMRAYFSNSTDSVGGLPTTWLMASMITRRMPDTVCTHHSTGQQRSTAQHRRVKVLA